MLLLIQGLFHSFPALGPEGPLVRGSPSGAKEGVLAETSLEPSLAPFGAGQAARSGGILFLRARALGEFCRALRGPSEALCGPFEHLLSCRAPVEFRDEACELLAG
jgi:hypothetical protein